jgi:hypothetical protein
MDIDKEVYLLKNIADNIKLVQNSLMHDHDLDFHHLISAKHSIEKFMVELYEFIQAQDKE